MGAFDGMGLLEILDGVEMDRIAPLPMSHLSAPRDGLVAATLIGLPSSCGPHLVRSQTWVRPMALGLVVSGLFDRAGS
jgi:hypothetical protein